MDMIARVRLTVEVPFKSDVVQTPEYPAPEEGRQWMSLLPEEQAKLAEDRKAHEEAESAALKSRVQAAETAETEIVEKLITVLGSKAGTVVETLVEEVREK